MDKEIFLEGNKTGVLLVHGLTGTPNEFERLSEFLNKTYGFTVYATLLPGHGSVPEDMLKYSHKDYETTVVAGVAKLKTTCEKVFVLGYSMGGVICGSVMNTKDIDAMLLISAPMFKLTLLKYPLYLLQYFIKYYSWDNGFRKTSHKEKILWTDYDGIKLYYYPYFPTKTLIDLFTMVEQTKKNLKSFTKPLFILQGDKDDTVKPYSYKMIDELSISEDKTVFTAEGSGHHPLNDLNKTYSAEKIGEWIEAHIED